MKEHKNDIRFLRENTELSKHGIENLYSVNWDSIKILDLEEDWYKRGIKERLYIKSEQKTCYGDSGRIEISDDWDLALVIK